MGSCQYRFFGVMSATCSLPNTAQNTAQTQTTFRQQSKSYTWPVIVTGPRSLHLSAYLHMLYSLVAHKLQGCRSRVRVHACTSTCSPCMWSARHGLGTFCCFIFERRRSFCALQTFLLLLTHDLAKVSPSAVPSTAPSPSLFALIDRSVQISLNCTHSYPGIAGRRILWT